MNSLSRWPKSRVVVFGDVILDRYVYGSVGRISPEAPVPVVRLAGEEVRPGGAANVVANVIALGARASLVSLVGDDRVGEEIAELLGSLGVSTEGLIVDAGRPTPEKTRILARHQQMIRLDRENDSSCSAPLAESLVSRGLALLEGADALILSDYAKGTLGHATVEPMLQAARKRGIPSIVDPKIRHFDLFQPATVVTPNQAEAAQATAREIRGSEDVRQAAQEILERIDVDAVLVTRGEDGMLLAPRGAEPAFIRAHSREVYDVTGAGDTVAAVMGVALAAGWSLDEAARVANGAASLAVGRIGTAAITLDEIRSIRDNLVAGD